VGGIVGFRACVAAVGWIPATILNIVLPETWPSTARFLFKSGFVERRRIGNDEQGR